MKILELFAGSRSIGGAGEEVGHTVWSTDLYAFEGIDKAQSILELNPNDVPFVPDMIWASPPCTYFSVASIGKHWNKDNTPKSDNAMLGVEIVKATMVIIEHFLKLNPNLVWYIENPRGKLRKLDFMLKFTDRCDGVRHTVTYCQYGDTRMKPTDIWTNNIQWQPKPICKNGDPCHVSAPRGSSTGTQGLKGNYERSKIPKDLCDEIIKVSTNIKSKQLGLDEFIEF